MPQSDLEFVENQDFYLSLRYLPILTDLVTYVRKSVVKTWVKLITLFYWMGKRESINYWWLLYSYDYYVCFILLSRFSI